MTVDDLLRLAWQAQRDGRGPLREAMLTLAVAEGGPGSGWAERCRARLLAERPKHFLGTHPSLESTLADPQVAEAIRRLRGQYPVGRVGWLRLRAEVDAGPYTGEVAPLETIVDALAGPPAEAEVRRDAAEAVRGPLARSRAEVVVGATPVGPRRAIAGFAEGDSSGETPAVREDDITSSLYLAVLLAIAMLLASVEAGRTSRAA
jgi:hypothetical protein